MGAIPKLQRGKSPGVYIVRLDFRKNWQANFMLLSDIHYDSLGCNRAKFKSDLEKAKAESMGVLILGDLMTLAEGKKDPRHSRDELRPEYLREDYLGVIVEDTAKFLAPYIDNIMMISRGNHEISFTAHNGVDPLSMLSQHLKILTGKQPTIAPYSGYVLFKLSKLHASGSRGSRQSIVLKYHHGSGGNSPVTKGAIQTARSIARWPTSDIIALGHIHQRFSMMMPRQLVTTQGRIITDRDLLHLQLGCYVQTDEQPDSWAQQKGFGTAALGGWILKLYCNVSTSPHRVKYMAIPTD
jgi:predicted phosphodiesterase